MSNRKKSPQFEQMPFYFDKDAEDFVPLLSHLSKGFASKNPDAQLEAVQNNLDRITENQNDTAVFVHTLQDKRHKKHGHIVATATANRLWTPTPEGWVDDVVTLPKYGGRGLGRAAMGALHGWFQEQGVSVVRLTSAGDREAAGDLYSKIGYVEGGQVWRAPLEDGNSNDKFETVSSEIDSMDAYEIYDLSVPYRQRSSAGYNQFSHNLHGAINSDTSQVVVVRDGNQEITGSAVATNCRIPTGNKAWVYGVNAYDSTGLVSAIRDAHGALRADGVTSSNYMTFGEPQEAIVEALQATGYEPRETRLYTIDLQQQTA